MASFFRTIVRAGPSRPTALFARAFTAPSLPTFQETPSTPSVPSTPTHASPTSIYPPSPYTMESSKPNPLPSPIRLPRGAAARIARPRSPTDTAEDLSNDGWWAAQSVSGPKEAHVGNQYSGRSIKVYSNDVMLPIRRLSGLLARTGVKKYVRRSEFYEKPSERKRRLGTERHRRRFQEMVREKVQTVQMIRNRG